MSISDRSENPAPSALALATGSACLICGRPVPDYVPQYCCNGQDCGCMGQPIDPCTCSKECDAALFENIGLPMDERRKKAGIALSSPNT